VQLRDECTVLYREMGGELETGWIAYNYAVNYEKVTSKEV
jgi:hypothetical protein